MPLLITPDSELGKELAKWERPHVYHHFPLMLYIARKRPDGVVSCGETDDGIFGGHPGSAEAFSRTCHRIVQNEDEERTALSQGWRGSMAEAREYHEKLERFVGDAAAHRAFEDRKMSPRAKAEAAAADAKTSQHVAEVPEKRRSKDPKKTKAPKAPKNAKAKAKAKAEPTPAA